MSQLAVALALVCSASAQTPASDDVQAILQDATEAAQAVRTAVYDGRLEMRAGPSERVVTGAVHLEKLDYSDQMAGKVAVEGKIYRVSEMEAFHAAYNGRTVRRYLASAGVVLQADPGYGGEELLRGSFGALLLPTFLTPFPFTAERRMAKLSEVGTEEVDGRVCRVIEALYEDRQMAVRWFLDAEDHLPRKQVRRFRSANGADVESILTISNLQVNDDLDPSVFELEPPEGVKVEQMGRRPPDPVEVGDIAPDFSITDSDGKTHTLVEHKGKLVVLDFWATWCPHCRRAMPSMQQLHDDYAERGVEIFGINCRERSSTIDPVAFVREQGYDYPVLIDSGEIAARYRVQGIPAFFVIGPDGKVLYRTSGFSDDRKAAIVGFIERYLAETGS